MSSICVVGSLVMDLVVWLSHLPQAHETQAAQRFERHPGGKGLNQAITAQRCGTQVSMIGKVGNDPFGHEFKHLLQKQGIDHKGVSQSNDVATSFAMPMILPNGSNSIVLVPQANMALTGDEVSSHAHTIQNSDVLMLQLEIPVAASLVAAKLAHQSASTIVLNPAPASQDITPLLPYVDWLIPNEIEATALSGMDVHSPEDAILAGRQLLAKGVRRGVIITLGAQGSVCVTQQRAWTIGAFPTQVMDPTGAGDAFCGAFATALATKQPLVDALLCGTAAGAHAVSIAGAAPSLPSRQNLQPILQANQPSIKEYTL